MASTYRQVGYGSTGSAVNKLQTILNEHGYDLAVDGIFGAKTRAAVRDYQKKNGLKLDGGGESGAGHAQLSEKRQHPAGRHAA